MAAGELGRLFSWGDYAFVLDIGNYAHVRDITFNPSPDKGWQMMVHYVTPEGVGVGSIPVGAVGNVLDAYATIALDLLDHHIIAEVKGGDGGYTIVLHRMKDVVCYVFKSRRFLWKDGNDDILEGNLFNDDEYISALQGFYNLL